MNNSVDSDRAVSKFQEYLRIKSTHPNPDQKSTVKFLNEYAKELDLEVENVVVGERRNVVVLMKWEGKDPTLKSLVLNSHWDVGPVFEEYWKHDPFGGFKDEKGDIYGRGAQDMKSVGIQYLEAIRVLKQKEKFRFQRNVYISFMPNEDIGGIDGMKLFVRTPQFKAMNPGLVLDEGSANADNKFSVFYGERYAWWLHVTCRGDAGNGSRFVENTAVEKMKRIMDSFFDFRKAEEQKLKDKTHLSLGDVTTANLTTLNGGVQINAVPAEINATFDFRISPTVDLAEFENQIKNWCEKAGKDVFYEFIQKPTGNVITKMDDENPWWKAFTGVFKDIGIEISKEIYPAMTDSRYLRELNYPAIGFSPIRNAPFLSYHHNELLNESMFLEGIYVYRKLIQAIADLI